jgi:hypothetical protein
MILRKSIRLLVVSLSLIALLVFATGVVSDWNHSNSTNDQQCPYCHMGHQAPAQLEVARTILLLKRVASLPPSENSVPVAAPLVSQTSPRAPPPAF